MKSYEEAVMSWHKESLGYYTSQLLFLWPVTT